MKVKDIIANTVWTPGSSYDEAEPSVSVLLPTFRRGKSGLFRKAVQSVLDQTLEDIELIIVDDGSTDGTSDQIAEFMEQDGRVSCLRHPNNIGLPAISEYEAFMRARGDYIAFSFDDDFFYPDALERLLQASIENPGKVCFGSVSWRSKEKGSSITISGKLGQPLTNYNIRSWNSVPNTAVLLPRHVINDVGFYDPHILMTRICDWDLWRRISEQYLLHFVDIEVGEVTGPETDDSLGKTYDLPSAASEEWMRGMPRDLRPHIFPDIDIFAEAPGLSKRAKSTISDLSRNHVLKRPWLAAGAISADSAAEKTIIVLTHQHNASTSLCFDYLPLQVRGKVRVLLSHGGYPLSELASCSCVVIVRLLDAYKDWIDAAQQMDIPLYYFLDDNFPELAEEGLSAATGEDFSIRSLRAKLRDFSGVLVSSHALVQYFETHLIHPNISLFPVSYAIAPKRLAPASAESDFDVVLVSIGGHHRQRGLVDNVLPGLRLLASEGRRIHFVIGGCPEEDFEDICNEKTENLTLTRIPFDVDLRRAQIQLAQYQPDIMVHAPNKTVNNRYKTMNVAISAYLLDCVLIAPDDLPYSEPSFQGAAVLVSPSNEPRMWHRALSALIANPQDWNQYKEKNASFCRTQFTGEQNVVVLQEMLKQSPAVTATRIEARMRALYLNKEVIGQGQSINMEPLRRNLSELSRLRNKTSFLRSLKERVRRPDIWPHVSPAFEGIRQHVIKSRIRGPSTYLELSQSLSEIQFVEYDLKLVAGLARTVTCAFSSDGFHDGIVGIEFVRPNGEVTYQTFRNANPLNFDMPVVFNLNDLVIPEESWRLRLFARSPWPIYVYEFAQYSWFGLKRKAIAPFASVEYVTAFESDKETSSIKKTISKKRQTASA